MNVASLFSSCLEVKSLFLSLYQKQQQNIPRKKKREKGKGAAESQATYSSSNIGFHGNKFGALWRLNSPMQSNAANITFVWSAFLWPRLVPFLLYSCSATRLVSQKMKKLFHKLTDLGLHPSPLKPFCCDQ